MAIKKTHIEVLNSNIKTIINNKLVLSNFLSKSSSESGTNRPASADAIIVSLGHIATYPLFAKTFNIASGCLVHSEYYSVI